MFNILILNINKGIKLKVIKNNVSKVKKKRTSMTHALDYF